MSRRRQGLSMTTILVIIVVCFVAFSLAICSAVYISRYKTSTIQNARTSTDQAVNQAALTVSNYIRDMGSVMGLITEELGENGDEAHFSPYFFRLRPDVVAITSYDEAGRLLKCWSPGRRLVENPGVNLSYDPQLHTVGGMSAPHVESIFQGYYPWVVTLAAQLEEGGSARSVALDLSFSSISRYINNVGIGRHGYCFIISREGDLIYHPQQQLIYSGLKTEDTAWLSSSPDGSFASDSVIYSIRTVKGSSWRVVGVSFVDELVSEQMAGIAALTIILVLTILIATALSSLVLSRMLSRPLHGLAHAMSKFEKDADHYTYQPVYGAREVRDLSASFDHMVGRIQQLMAKVREEEMDLRKTELKALQTQINPHFLYNTLDSIAWMCEQGRNADAVHMVHALARLFRISISRGHELIPISKEIEHAESYLQIQKYRYKDQFEYEFRVDPTCTDFLCNKITLQPIIENALYHGLDLMVEEGRIEVEVRRDGDDILFVVTDDGVGMSPEQAASLLEKDSSDRTGIGIKNVNDRLRIYFGEGYGLTITSELDVGTRVEIRMPQVREGEYRV